MKPYFKIFALVLLSSFLVSLSSCNTTSQARKASKMAKKRYKYIQHDCNCHSFVYPMQEEKTI